MVHFDHCNIHYIVLHLYILSKQNTLKKEGVISFYIRKISTESHGINPTNLIEIWFWVFIFDFFGRFT